MTRIVNSKIKGRELTHGETMGMVMVLYFGGLDTVLSSLGWYFRHLAVHPKTCCVPMASSGHAPV